MAGLAGKEITNTYKDILTVLGSTQNEGLTSSTKQIFDGEGVASAMWLSTNLLQVGTSVVDANLTVHGQVKAKKYAMITEEGNTYISFSVENSGAINIVQDLVTKGSVTFKKDGHDDLLMDAENSSIKKGDGTKGNVKLGDTSVTLQKGSTDLLGIKDDGTLKLQSVSSLPSNPEAGAIINYNGTLNIGV